MLSQLSVDNLVDVDKLNKLGDMDKAKAVANIFGSTLATETDIEPASFRLQSVWLMGTKLNISLPQEDFENFGARVDDACRHSSVMLRAWYEEAENAWYLFMSTEAWQSTRRDRNKGSKNNTVKNTVPANSHELIQTVKVSSDADLGMATAYAGNKVSASFSKYQLDVHFLRMSARLSPADIEKYIGYRSTVEVEGRVSRGEIVAQGRTSEEKAMLRSACRAAEHPQKHGYVQHLATILDPKRLDQFERGRDISYAERSFKDQWAVLIHIPGREAAAALKTLQPSFFVTWSSDLGFEPQVYVLDHKVCGADYCMLVSCSKQPSTEDTGSMLEDLKQKLGTTDNDKAWASTPMQKGDTSFFRGDGDLKQECKTMINSAYKEVTDRGRLSESRAEGLLFRGSSPTPWSFSMPETSQDPMSPPDTASASSSSMMPGPGWDSDLGDVVEETRQPWTWLIWVRQSDEDGIKARTTIPRQLTTALVSELLWGRRPGDRICIYVEVCSSNKHSWHERKLPRSIPKDRPIKLLTVNPDRITRRPEEVDVVLGMLAEIPGGVWYTRGLPAETGESSTEWVEVTDDVGKTVQKIHSIGRQKALGTGEFIRSDMATTRLNDYLQRTSPEIPAQILALHAAVRRVIKLHGYRKILLVARNCPVNLEVQKHCLNTSIMGQIQFLRNMLPKDLDPGIVVQWKAEGLSAFKDDFVDGLAEELSVHGEKVLVLSVRLDHMTRSAAQHARLKKLLSKGGHGAMSFHWDYKTDLDVQEAFQLDGIQCQQPAIVGWEKALESQQRAPFARVNWPIIQPILWALHDQESETVNRHVQTAEQWSQSVKMSAYQGDELFKDEDGIEVDIIFSGHGLSFSCACERTRPKTHDPECQCRCWYCERKRACSCDRSCVCPPMCNCHCENCHRGSYDAGNKKKKDGAESEDEFDDNGDPRPKPPRICREKNCGKEIIAKRDIRCVECKLHHKAPPKVVRKCSIPGCNNDAPVGTEFGRVCRSCTAKPGLGDSDPDCKRQCAVQNCKDLAPRGGPFGRSCSSACRRKLSGPLGKRKWEQADAGEADASQGGSVEPAPSS